MILVFFVVGQLIARTFAGCCDGELVRLSFNNNVAML